MTWLRKKRMLLLLFLGFTVILFANSQWLSLFYPIHYKEEIRYNAQLNQLDPFIVAAIIKVETNYENGTESSKGALGVMQIMPDTARDMYSNAEMDRVKHEPDMNILIGTRYLKWLSGQFDGNEVAMVAAYNAGQANVKNWIKSGRWDGTLETSKEIPFGQTRHYVKRVFHYYNQYSDIYDKL